MKSKSSLIAISLLSALFLLPGCADDHPQTGFRYPLAVGNTWEYTRKWDIFYYTDSTASTYDDTTTILSDIRVTVMDTASLAGISGLYRMAATEHDSLDSYEGIQYYGQDEDGLYLNGYEGSATLSMPKGLPAREGQGGIYFKGMYFNSAGELLDLLQQELPTCYTALSDSIILEEPPVKVLHYPLETGVTWTYRTSENSWRIDKHVEGEEQITVPAGEFVCYKIKWLYDIDDNGEWDTDIFIIDHIGEVGLTQRQLTLLGGIRMNENGEEVGYSDIKTKYTLETVSLEE